jgi:hypothetical protein
MGARFKQNARRGGECAKCAHLGVAASFARGAVHSAFSTRTRRLPQLPLAVAPGSESASNLKASRCIRPGTGIFHAAGGPGSTEAPPRTRNAAGAQAWAVMAPSPRRHPIRPGPPTPRPWHQARSGPGQAHCPAEVQTMRATRQLRPPPPAGYRHTLGPIYAQIFEIMMSQPSQPQTSQRTVSLRSSRIPRLGARALSGSLVV